MKWLKDQGAIDAPAATNRPSGTAWASTGFVVVSVVGDASATQVAGRGSAPDVPWWVPVLSFDVWTVSTSGGQPPYGHAAGIAQILREAAMSGLGTRKTLDTLPGFDRVRIDTAYPVSELRRIAEPDGSSFAHYSVDIALGWVRVPT